MTENSPQSWQTWYLQEEKQISDERIASVRALHMPFINAVLAHNPEIAIEVGIGTGTLGYSVGQISAERGFRTSIIEVDYCIPFLQAAKDFNGGQDIAYVGADTLALPFGRQEKAVIFHQGLLEHFEDQDIVRMLKEQLRVTGLVVATMPSHEYCFPQGLRGDERLMSIEEWTAILHPHYSVSGFYYGLNPGERYHICLTVKDKHVD
jgi:hypothetical protein